MARSNGRRTPFSTFLRESDGMLATGEAALPEQSPLDLRERYGLAALTLLMLQAVMLRHASLWTDEMYFIIYKVGIDANSFEAPR